MPRILLVEDSSSTRKFVRVALEAALLSENASLEVVEASSGFDALRLLPRGAYDLVISDVNMPDINGLELVKFVRTSERHRKTPFVLMSTQGSLRDKQRGLELGADDFLAKPFSAEELRDSIGRLLPTRAPG